MKILYTSMLFVLVFISVSAQNAGQTKISEMKWGLDYNLHIKLSNDTNYVMDVRGLYHTGKNPFIDTTEQSTTYYPVTLDNEFIQFLKDQRIGEREMIQSDTTKTDQPKTLWASLHKSIGGGYVHFINCLIYTLESNQLYLTDPIMKRPISDWKPKPMTESFKRTHKWEFYIPYDQRTAKKEYSKRKSEEDLKDLQGIPASFIELFLSTHQKQYEQFRADQKKQNVSQIDIVRLLLGAKYLGMEQIQYIQSKVLTAVLRYNINTLPSVIIFDDYNAAVSMTLDNTGYKIGYIVFRDQNSISPEESNVRFKKIEAMVKAVNDANNRVFKKRLQNYYQKK
ncbi:MAG: hypothetical protein EHM93_14740 [Bacteroidales bacterium]|nr:MAG: hypothetical protein EHM93_14740 [Bacteroidales bacterium]